MKPAISLLLLVVLFLLCILAGCSASQPYAVELIEEGQAVITSVQTSQDDDLNLLYQTATEFNVPFDEALVATERVNLFFSRYLKRPIGKSDLYEAKGSTGRGVLRKGFSSHYRYEVLQKPHSKGYLFAISCWPEGKADKRAALTNAQNLARFIRQGRLEAHLLVD